ncbi:MAG: hypothetical protein O7B30_02345 [Thaumarchaeota archaeon]|nr:hypothetical protein [Nitrososphaerota archaeon]
MNENNWESLKIDVKILGTLAGTRDQLSPMEIIQTGKVSRSTFFKHLPLLEHRKHIEKRPGDRYTTTESGMFALMNFLYLFPNLLDDIPDLPSKWIRFLPSKVNKQMSGVEYFDSSQPVTQISSEEGEGLILHTNAERAKPRNIHIGYASNTTGPAGLFLIGLNELKQKRSELPSTGPKE